MLKVDLIHSDVRPRDTCVDAANQVAELLRIYRKHFDMRACQLVLTHVLLSVCVVHLLHSSESQASRRNLVEGMQALEDMSVCHYFGARGFKIVHALSGIWKLPFPNELKSSKLLTMESVDSPAGNSLLFQQPTTSIASRMGGGVGYTPIPSATQSLRRESLTMFSHADRKSRQLSSHTSASHSGTVATTRPQHQHSQPNNAPPYPPPSTTTTSTSQRVSTSSPTLTTSGPAETLFWTMPGIGVPILPRNYPISPMDLDTMLGNVNEWDRFSRDGFKMSDTWQQDPAAGYVDGHPEGFDQGNGQSNSYNHSADAVQYSDAGHFHQQAVQHSGGQAFDAGWWDGEGTSGPLS
jgi:hypothetical protein